MKKTAERKAKPASRKKNAKPEFCPALYQVVAECRSEREQRDLYVELKAKGYRCRLLNL
ncbi:hypothetical protein [Blastopirellula marina]|uniref:hypothetical protein n=1 Tax=Blastopirellula marina TaxID=124 RepID=UPI00130485D1|nr:hypothetical protein [Blastopirellula marina]